MTGPMQRIFRRRASGSPRRGAPACSADFRPACFAERSGANRLPWGKRPPPPRRAAPVAEPQPTQETQVIVQEAAGGAGGGGGASFRDRGKLRRRLRFLRRARELAFRDIGGLMFDMRRFGRERPDLVEAKIGALAAVDQELRALERILDDRRPLHELREPGITSCARCGALHASESNFCPNCGLQVGGSRAMGEVGGAIAAPPQAPLEPVHQPAAAGRRAPAAPHRPRRRLAPPAADRAAARPSGDAVAADRATAAPAPARRPLVASRRP